MLGYLVSELYELLSPDHLLSIIFFSHEFSFFCVLQFRGNHIHLQFFNVKSKGLHFNDELGLLLGFLHLLPEFRNAFPFSLELSSQIIDIDIKFFDLVIGLNQGRLDLLLFSLKPEDSLLIIVYIFG